jgi:hypothetical protein
MNCKVLFNNWNGQIFLKRELTKNLKNGYLLHCTTRSSACNIAAKVIKYKWLRQVPPVHTAGLDTIFVQIYMDALPGFPGVSKNQNFFFTKKTVEFLR